MKIVKHYNYHKVLEDKLLSLPIIDKYKEISVLNNKLQYKITFKDKSTILVDIYYCDDLYPSTLLKIINNKSTDNLSIVIGPYISDRGIQLCKDNNLNYIDECGNMFFNCDHLYISEIGNKNVNVKHKEAKNVFSSNSLITSLILRCLLKDIDKVWKIKDLSKEVSCSIGQVSKVINNLIKTAYVSKTSKGYKISDLRGLLDTWSNAYKQEKKDTLKFYSLDNIVTIEKELNKLNKEGIKTYLSGFSGGVRYAPVVNYNKIHLYVDINDLEKIIDRLELKEVDSGENVVIMIANKAITYDNRTINGDSVVSPLQDYLDLMCLKSRGEEMANEIYKRVIKNI